MKKNRRQFLVNSGKFTLAAYLASTFWACETPPPGEEIPFQIFKLFSDNMILQRDQPIPVWGWATPQSEVQIFFDQKTHTTKTSEQGKWIFELPPLPTGGNYEMKITHDNQHFKILNILIGDVFLCSGQSNMEWGMNRTEGVEEEIANGLDDQIRHFKIPPGFSKTPEEKLRGGNWEICSPETLGNFTAAGYFFAKNLRKDLNVPIGLINATRGGSNIKMWMHSQTLNFGEGKKALLKLNKIEEEAREKRKAKLQKKYLTLPEKDFTIENEKAVWADTELDDSNWATINLPINWGYQDFMEMDGVFWFRKEIYLDKKNYNKLIAGSSKRKTKVSIGQIDDADQVFLNGKKIGAGQNDFKKPRVYEVENSFFQNGKNVLTIRLEDHGGFGGVFGEPDQMFIEFEDKNIPLAGEWKIKIEVFKYENEILYDHGEVPTVSYNTMIHPLHQFPIKAILWYQAESDVLYDPKVLYNYRNDFLKLIQDWRERFGAFELPFIFAQLSNAHLAKDEPSDSNWARIRESQAAALQLKNTAMVVNIDSGKHDNSMHPQNKPELGRRLALAAQQLIYGKENAPLSPVFSRMKKNGNELLVFFKNAQNGLILKNGNKLLELAIAGKDRKFKWAESKIEHDYLVVWHDEISDPVAVRYAWADNPLGVNLYSREGLPVAPFRTDDW